MGARSGGRASRGRHRVCRARGLAGRHPRRSSGRRRSRRPRSRPGRPHPPWSVTTADNADARFAAAYGSTPTARSTSSRTSPGPSPPVPERARHLPQHHRPRRVPEQRQPVPLLRPLRGLGDLADRRADRHLGRPTRARRPDPRIGSPSQTVTRHPAVRRQLPPRPRRQRHRRRDGGVLLQRHRPVERHRPGGRLGDGHRPGAGDEGRLLLRPGGLDDVLLRATPGGTSTFHGAGPRRRRGRDRSSRPTRALRSATSPRTCVRAARPPRREASLSPAAARRLGTSLGGLGVLAPLLAAGGDGDARVEARPRRAVCRAHPGAHAGCRAGRARRPSSSREPTVAVQFTPPEGVQPGMLGTIIDEEANVVDVTATLIDLAVRGYLVIEEVHGDAFWVKRRLAADPDLAAGRLAGPQPLRAAPPRLGLRGRAPRRA